VHIKDNAKLEQDGSTVHSDSIEYFINQELVTAATRENSEGVQRRVEVVIPPHKIEEQQNQENE
jgi:lipopolysaccharide export system protein LptA